MLLLLVGGIFWVRVRSMCQKPPKESFMLGPYKNPQCDLQCSGYNVNFIII